MEPLKNKEFKGLFFEIQKEEISTGRFAGDFVIFIRITNLNDIKKKVHIKINYISVEHGYIESDNQNPVDIGYGLFLVPNSFVDASFFFYSRNSNLRNAQDGDRMEFIVNDGKIASLLLIRDKGDWYIADNKESGSVNTNLKNRIEHFEYLDEKFGLTLQKISARIVDENSIKLLLEVVALNGDVQEEGFNIEVAIYDTEDDIVYHSSIKRYDGDFKGFEVFNFGTITLDIPVEEIGKIRIYPTR